MSYFLRLGQIKNLMDHDQEKKLPPMLEKSILFTEDGLVELDENLKKLDREIGTRRMTQARPRVKSPR